MLRLTMNMFPGLMLVLMGLMDCITTVVGVAIFGAIECNPLMAGLITTNLSAFITLKLTATVLICLAFIQAEKTLMRTKNKTSKTFAYTKKLLKTAFYCAIGSLVITVINNLIVLSQAI